MTSSNEGFPNALVEGMALGLAPVSVNCMTGPAEILVEGGDAASLRQWFGNQVKEGNLPVKYGEYGILVPVMDSERNLNPKQISEEERNMAEIIIKLMGDEEELARYRQAAARRARCFTYEKYVEQFLALAQNL